MKRKRANNFSFVEKELLLKLALNKKDVIENKTSNYVSWKEKEKAWEEISVEYNSQTTGCPRDGIGLRIKYENIKKKMRGTKGALFATGGGPPFRVYEPSTENEAELYRIIQVSVNGIPCDLDSDSNRIGDCSQPDKNQCDPLLFELHNIGNHTWSTLPDDPICSSSTSLVNDLLTTKDDDDNVCTWIPAESVKLLRNNEKHEKLTADTASCSFVNMTVSNNVIPTEVVIPEENISISTPLTKKKIMQRKKFCQSSVSQNIQQLTDDKKILVKYQEQLVKQEMSQSAELHQKKLEYLRLEHEMKMSNLKLKNQFLKKQLEN